MNHTPGPWRYEPSIPEEGVNCWWIERVGRPARTIGCVDGPQGSHTEPDARLIAAAPDMLASLLMLRTLIGRPGWALDGQNISCVVAAMHGAINKATGAGHE